MRPAIDHEGRIWFGEMGHNLLADFDPHSQKFQQITPPRGRSGIMGVIVAADDTIWFAEQYANYIGHYFPATGQFQTYPLPTLTVPDQGVPGKTLTLPSAPNDLALDKQGNIWFTELNANAVGRLNMRSGQDSTIFPYNDKDDSIAQSIRDNYRSTGQYLVHRGQYKSYWSPGSKNRSDQLLFHARIIDTTYGDRSRSPWYHLGYFVFIWSST